MTPSERIYRAALAAYPRDYRAARGDEVLGTMLDATEARRLPDVREVGSVVPDGYRRRVVASVTPPLGALQAGAAWAAFALAVLTAAVAVLGVMREDHLATSLPASLAPSLHVLGLAISPWFAAFAVTSIGALVALVTSERRAAIAFAITGVAVQVWEVAFRPAAGFPGAHGDFAAYAWTNVSTLRVSHGTGSSRASCSPPASPSRGRDACPGSACGSRASSSRSCWSPDWLSRWITSTAPWPRWASSFSRSSRRRWPCRRSTRALHSRACRSS